MLEVLGTVLVCYLCLGGLIVYRNFKEPPYNRPQYVHEKHYSTIPWILLMWLPMYWRWIIKGDFTMFTGR